MSQIPDHHLSGLEGIYYADLNKDSKKGEFKWGSYEILEKKVIIDFSIKDQEKVENSKTHEIGHHLWYDKLPISLKLKWKAKCLQFRLYDSREAFADQYASMFGFEKEYVPESKDFEKLMQNIFLYLEKNKEKQNSNFNKIFSYLFI